MEQIITAEGEIVPQLDEQIKSSEIAEAGVDYHTLAIIGCQSSGKSTILNLLFGTKFKTMDEQKGRQQTTRGIHAAKAVNSQLLLFDVEGSDSRERGDADALFERKASLFALALSEVLIINMWESDIGRYNAANIPMLKTVFEVNVQLFLAQSTTKSKIVFVVRDRTAPNFEAITWQLNRDMNAIWSEISLPDALKDKKITDFFEFEYFSIHHMKIERGLFDQDVNTLRRWFIDPSYEHFLFSQRSSKIVPGEGLGLYIRNLWSVINENKELNIPSQRTMLAQFKCDENAKLSLEAFTMNMKENLEKIIIETNKPHPQFKMIGNSLVNEALKSYHDSSWRYQETIVKERGDELQKEIKILLEPLFKKQCSFYADSAMSDFVEYLSKHSEGFNEGENWTLDLQGKIDELNTKFYQKVESTKIDPFLWNYPVHETQKQMTEMMAQQEQMLVSDLHKSITNEYMRTYVDEVSEILRVAKSQMWDELKALILSYTQKTTYRIASILKTNAPYSKVSVDIHKSFENEALSLIKESANYIMLKMKTAFDKNFKYEKNGRPRVWKRNDNINHIYEDSRRSAILVLRLFTYCRLGDTSSQIYDDPLNQILIPQDKSDEIEMKFERIIIHTYEEAVSNIKAQANNERIPTWAWILFFAFSYDYILKIISNPFIFIFVMLFGGTFFILKSLGLLEIAQKTLISKFNNLLKGLASDENEEQQTKQHNEKDQSPRNISNK